MIVWFNFCKSHKNQYGMLSTGKYACKWINIVFLKSKWIHTQASPNNYSPIIKACICSEN